MKRSRVIVWKAKDGWRWRGESGEAYKELRKAIAGFDVCWAVLQWGVTVTLPEGRKP